MVKTIASYVRIRRVSSMLPGANCASCGAEDCRDFARMIVRDRADASRCSLCDAAMIDRIRRYLALN